MATNFALASNGATASANIILLGSPSVAINGDRTTNNNYTDNCWTGGNVAGGQTSILEINFNATRSISWIELFFLRTAVNYTVEPTDTETTSSYAITAFTVEYWNGSSWVNIATVTGNSLVRKRFDFSPITTTKVRVVITGAQGNAYVTEFEAWGVVPLDITTTTLPNGTVGASYSQNLSATGGTGSLTWSEPGFISSLPPGLSLSSTGLISGVPSATGIYTFSVEVIDSLGATDGQSLTITIDDAPPAPILPPLGLSGHLVPKIGLLQWCSADSATVSGSNVTGMVDRSGHRRDVSAPDSYPQIANGVLNSLPVVRFTATTKPLSYSETGTVNAQHFFIVVALRDATFANVSGILTPPSGSTTILSGQGAGSALFYNLSFGGSFEYRKRNRQFPESAMAAPVSGAFAVVEVKLPSAFSFNGFQVGQDRSDTTRRGNIDVAEWMVYADALGDLDREKIYRYFARKYLLWEEKSSGLYYFPFTPNFGGKYKEKKEVMIDYAEDYTPNYRTKRPKKRFMDLTFQSRQPDEVNAASAFVDQHFPGGSFVFRDRTEYPAREVTCRFSPETEIERVPSNHISNSYELKLDEV